MLPAECDSMLSIVRIRSQQTLRTRGCYGTASTRSLKILHEAHTHTSKSCSTSLRMRVAILIVVTRLTATTVSIKEQYVFMPAVAHVSDSCHYKGSNRPSAAEAAIRTHLCQQPCSAGFRALGFIVVVGAEDRSACLLCTYFK